MHADMHDLMTIYENLKNFYSHFQSVNGHGENLLSKINRFGSNAGMHEPSR